MSDFSKVEMSGSFRCPSMMGGYEKHRHGADRDEQGNFGDHKFCRDAVGEMRIDVGAGYRVYYAQTGSRIVQSKE